MDFCQFNVQRTIRTRSHKCESERTHIPQVGTLTKTAPLCLLYHKLSKICHKGAANKRTKCAWIFPCTPLEIKLFLTHTFKHIKIICIDPSKSTFNCSVM